MSKKTVDSGKVFGVKTDQAIAAVDVAGSAAGLAADFIPGGRMIGGAVELSTAGIKGSLQERQDEERLQKAGIDVHSSQAKHNTTIKARKERNSSRWQMNVGKAGTSVVAGGIGAAAGFAIGCAAFPGPGCVAGAKVGTIAGTVGGAIGGAALGFVGSKGYDMALKPDQKDEVDLAVKIADAQRLGEQVPAEAVFAQWAASQKGKLGEQLDQDLREKTGTSDFNEAIEQGKFAEIRQMMSNRAYEKAMRAQVGMTPDSQNLDRHVADQLTEWINAGQLPAKDLVLGKSMLPNYSLEDARQAGLVSDPVVVPSVQMSQQMRMEKASPSLAV
jgi:hypothetical protein